MFKDRFSILILFVCLVGVTFVVQLFNLQIINGASYREQSEKRLVREVTTYAPRGEIYDRYGKILVTNQTSYNVQIYKTKIDASKLNEVLLELANILEKNGDEYSDNFPVDFETMTFTLSDESSNNWKKKYGIEVSKTASDVVDYFKKKYKIENNDINDIRKILQVRFEIGSNGYTSYKAITVAKAISTGSMMEIEERSAELSGVNIYTQPIRKYTAGSVAAHVIGYIGRINSSEYEKRKDSGYSQNDLIGKTGIEATFEELLKGKNGTKRLEMDSNGRVSDDEEIGASEMGKSIILTLDLDLQTVTEKVLEENILKIQTGGFAQKYEDARAGAAIVINVKTGEVLALASYPSYNPDEFTDGINNSEYTKYFEGKDKPMFNRAIQGTYSPGSTYKMIVAIAGIESGAIGIKEKVNDVGVFYLGHKPACWIWKSRREVHGEVDAEAALKVSCNYYFYEVGSRIGSEVLAKYAKSFGLGEKTGIELIGEKAGILSSKEYVDKLRENGSDKVWTIGDTLSSSIGQSYNSFTPLQMAYYIATLASKGDKKDLTIIKNVIDAEGKIIDKGEYEDIINEKLGVSSEQLEMINVKDETYEAIFAGMKSVTGDSGGTAYGTFSSFPIEVAGKTGTATAGSGSDNAWFVGFAPYDDPEIAVVSIVEHGGHGYYTAPAVKQIMEEYFGYNNNNIDEDLKLKSTKLELIH